ncbi:MFS transporter [Paraburkholderia domus]|uniref:Fosfomycin resistance protein AbaF n=1 Tax=Paraburkholderia domus TaxID=2793075 RepID=A0A9N8R5T7_9BURK|nr:MFS transporter [Paraburkholderia domus]MBK5054508.1 MFS transporter [Burkholderia sp. R-70006]MBK5066109.1 MFS transporter [Burkholderia sp. R-70199]MBK5122217.1 MFS transporter [Burkholderia sp. R-69980]MBK5169715.1 MFS transporter [Burkholderia sp. R-70211]MBK5185416.1 MFS transporter [Burkholderia sp. R-69749]
MQAQHRDVLSDAHSAPDAPANQMKRVGAAGFTGTLIEFYDLQIYTTAAALVFAHVFFPQLGKAAGTIAAFGTIGVVFVARPLGSVLFGHFGDRLGRKQTLVITLLMMGISTVLVGVLPTSEQIGIFAPILLILLRVIQGVAAGGEFAGAALLVSENAPPERRGAWSALPSLGGAASTCAAGITLLLTSLTMSDATFRAWGWRLPFLFSAILLAVGLYIRMRMTETPVFAKQVSRHGTSRIPVLDAFASQPRDLLLGCMVEVPAFSMLYLVVTYVIHYGVSDLKLPYTNVLLVTVGSGVVTFLGILVSSRLSDRFGRRPVLIVSNGLATVWALALFPILYSGTMTAYAVAVIVTLLIGGLIFGPVGAFMSELFHTRYRYTAVGLCYNASGILGGALPPLFAGPIIAAYGPYAFGRVLAILCFVSVCCCIALKETRGRSLDG